jgi:hypothetical protein
VIVLDENFPASQHVILISKGLKPTKIGIEIATKGIKDDQIIPLLLRLNRPTFITLDQGFFQPHLCHPSYCLIQIEAKSNRIAEISLRALRHSSLRTFAQRAGYIVRASDSGISLYHMHHSKAFHLSWATA